MPLLFAFFVLVEGAEYRITQEHMERVDEDPWVPCEQQGTRGFCRLSCNAKWSFRPEFNNCEMLDQDQLLKRSFGVKAADYRILSEDTYSSVPPRHLSPHHSCNAHPHAFYSLQCSPSYYLLPMIVNDAIITY